MIRMDAVSLRLGDATILEEVDLHVGRGDKVALTGPSGSGKSSLLKLVLGIYRQSAGVIEIGGIGVAPGTVAASRRAIAYVPQAIPVFPGEGARDFLFMPYGFRTNRGGRPGDDRVASVLESLGLALALLDRSMSALSGGERQRLALARALLLGRETFVLDEVSSAIDREARERVACVVLDDPRLTVLSVSHDEAWIARSSRVLRLVDGRMLPPDPDPSPGAEVSHDA
jgi:putative ABC transport system ATP-binding protein